MRPHMGGLERGEAPEPRGHHGEHGGLPLIGREVITRFDRTQYLEVVVVQGALASTALHCHRQPQDRGYGNDELGRVIGGSMGT